MIFRWMQSLGALNPSTFADASSVQSADEELRDSSEDTLKHDYELVGSSGLFDRAFYLTEHPDVAKAGIDPIDHYLRFGAQENRSVGEEFDAPEYLRLNPDVAAAGLNPLVHYIKFGREEGRAFKSTDEAAVIDDTHYAMLSVSPFFDSEWYLEANPDVRERGVDPIVHYLTWGAQEGRRPSRIFDPEKYLRLCSDLPAAVDNPLVHFLTRGIFAGRAERLLGRAVDAFLTTTYPTELPRSDVAPYSDYVDVIICVHNALDDVMRCVQSLVRATVTPIKLILVDDGSDAPTTDYLRFVASITGATFIRNEKAMGYTRAANIGLRASESDYCVLLNSDTEVTFGWLDTMLRYMQLDASCGMVGPLSNTASWQSVPRVFEGEEWAANELPEGWTVQDMADNVALNSNRQGIPLGFLNGFCLLLRKSMLKQIGYFDEATFGAGYGEENDLCIRARKEGWRLVVADDAYIYHYQSRSYGNERRRLLATNADRALSQKHSHLEHIGPYVHICKESLLLKRTRVRVSSNRQRVEISNNARRKFELRRACFILPVADAGGGANVIIQEIRALRKFGVDAWIANDIRYKSNFENAYPHLDIPIIYFDRPDATGVEELLTHSMRFDAVIATSFSSFSLLPLQARDQVLCYYIQDFEPQFFTESDPRRKRAESTYKLRPEVVRVTKTAWNREAVRAIGGIPPATLGASVDVDRFYPIGDQGLDPRHIPLIVAMVRPDTPRRRPLETLKVLQRINDAFGSSVKTSMFGGHASEIQSLGVSPSGIENHGPLSPGAVARLLSRADIFLDFSEWQAMGLTALEAMACGAAVVGPKRGGFSEYAKDGWSALLIDTDDEAECLAAAEHLINNFELRKTIMSHAVEVGADLYPEKAALALCEQLWGSA
jgi:GT2 family glycosyltransferase